MAERIQQTCTVHKSDVFAVLVALEDVITEALKGGEIVRLGELGTFQIGISSKVAITEEDYTDTLIKKGTHQLSPRFDTSRCPQRADLPEGSREVHPK